MVLVLVKFVSNWSSELFEKSVFSLVLATTGIQQHEEILCLQNETSRGVKVNGCIPCLHRQVTILRIPCGNLGCTGRGQQGRQNRWRSCQLPTNFCFGAV